MSKRVVISPRSIFKWESSQTQTKTKRILSAIHIWGFFILDPTNHRFKTLKKKKNSRKFPKAKLQFALQTTIDTALTLHLQLFTKHLCCVRYYKSSKEDLQYRGGTEVDEPRADHTEWSKSKREKKCCVLTHLYTEPVTLDMQMTPSLWQKAMRN